MLMVFHLEVDRSLGKTFSWWRNAWRFFIPSPSKEWHFFYSLLLQYQMRKSFCSPILRMIWEMKIEHMNEGKNEQCGKEAKIFMFMLNEAAFFLAVSHHSVGLFGGLRSRKAYEIERICSWAFHMSFSPLCTRLFVRSISTMLLRIQHTLIIAYMYLYCIIIWTNHLRGVWCLKTCKISQR